MPKPRKVSLELDLVWGLDNKHFVLLVGDGGEALFLLEDVVADQIQDMNDTDDDGVVEQSEALAALLEKQARRLRTALRKQKAYTGST